MILSKKEIRNMLGNSSRIQADMIAEAICDNPESYGNLIELSLEWMNSPNETIAVRVLCMIILERIALQDQWLIPELIFTIEDIIEKGDAVAILGQDKKTIKKLRKLML